MSTSLPYRYHVRLVSRGEDAILTDDVKPPIVGGAPPEFGGSGAWWSPEHLLLSAISLCFAATFRAFASRAAVLVHEFTSEVDGVLERRAGEFVFASIELRVSTRVADGQAELTERLLQSAKRHCIVANALKAPVGLTTAVTVEEALPA